MLGFEHQPGHAHQEPLGFVLAEIDRHAVGQAGEQLIEGVSPVTKQPGNSGISVQ
ncbi:MAG: hypothetical protein ACR2NR_19900 [Solirubrobacteraceae bacterium]